MNARAVLAIGCGYIGRVSDGRRRAVLILVSQHRQARVLVGIDRIAKRVQDSRAELDRCMCR